ncbi:hypothetical protein [Herpetosiphon geysericola]|uniref:Uncharacterized protein n=1 Tax=Herpetosiphon geysericola TaxID=70996 RepID=A0A0P6Z3C6_9CHLR|nr:hypothetical protein [Herpetosiphon geysericola]KPL91915.1 hypothetical protein SE18_00740 [Herpetosiphon geysericola]
MVRVIREVAKFSLAGLLVVGSCIGLAFWVWEPPLPEDSGYSVEWQQIVSDNPTQLYFEVRFQTSEAFTQVWVEALSKPTLELWFEPLVTNTIQPFVPFVIRGSVSLELAAPGDSIEFALHRMKGETSRTINLNHPANFNGTVLMVR